MENNNENLSSDVKSALNEPISGKSILKYVGLGLAIFLLIMFFDSSDKPDDGRSRKDEAWTCAQMKIEGMLLSPKSADFEFGGATNSTKAIGDEKYEIKSYVDSENAFSAKIRKNFECTVKLINEDNSCETYCKFIN